MQTQPVERTILQAGGLAGALFHEAGDGLVVVSPATERILDANVKACELSEFSRADLLQLPIRNLIRHEQEWQDWLQPVQQTMTYHGKDGFLLRTRNPARWVPVSVSISRLHPPDGEALALFTLRDRTEQVEAYRRMQRTEAELRRVLVSVSDCLWSCRVEANGRWRYRYLSPVVQRLTGRSVGVFLEDPRAWERSVDARDLPRWLEFRARLGAGHSGELEYRMHRPDGPVVWVRENVVAAPDEGGLLLHGVVADVTGRKRVEPEAPHPTSDLRRLDGQASMAGGVAHAFAGIISAILGQAHLARSETRGNQSLRSIEDLAARGAELCRQLASFGGEGQASLGAVVLRPLLEDVAKHVPHAEAVAVRVEGTRDATVQADPALLSGLLRQLLANAVQACGQGPGEVVLRLLSHGPDQPAVSYAGPDASLVWFEVKDNGHGMSSDVLSRAFEPFFTTRDGHQGLGLSTVLGVVRGHKGAMHIVSTPQEGTSVKVGLMVEQGTSAPDRAAESAPEKPLVLLADDEETVLDVVSRLLGTLGFRVIPARNGEQVLEAYRQHPTIQLALIDLSMPKMGGDQAMRKLREAAPKLPIVLMSGYPEGDIRAQFAEVPLVSYLQKPFRLPALIDMVRKVLPK
jgi:signal transduction histidine kinase/CheY-like chemotaxis protein